MWRGSGRAFDMEMDRTEIMAVKVPSRRQRRRRIELLLESAGSGIARQPKRLYDGHQIRAQRGGAHVRITSAPQL